MKADDTNSTARDRGSLLITFFFILAGFVTLYDTMGYSDRDSQVFPQAVAIFMIVAATASLVVQFIRPRHEEGFGDGSWWRRILLVAAMLATCIAMPVTGFLPAAAITFGGGLIAAMYDEWTAKNAVTYILAGAVLMATFYALFKFVLHVPLP